MKHVLIIGSGISGMACAVRCAQRGVHATLASPFPSERSQSVMAAGGINAVLPEGEPGDSVLSHIGDTLKGGCFLGGEKAVTGLCEHGGESLRYLEGIGTVFSVDGHDYDQLIAAFEAKVTGKPKCIVAHTVKGKGVSFMENQVKWHGAGISDEQLSQALKELDEEGAEA